MLNKGIHLLLVFISVALSLSAEPVNLSNPRAAFRTHFANLQDGDYNPALAAAVIRDTSLTEKQKIKLVIQIKQIFDGKGKVLYGHLIPDNPNYISKINEDHNYFLDSLGQQIFLEKVNDKWYYSEYTVAQIPRLHKEVFVLGTDKLVNLLSGKASQNTYLGLYTWQYLGVFIIVFFAFILFKILTLLIDRLMQISAHRLSNFHVPIEYIHPITMPISWLVVFLLVNVFIPVLLLPVSLGYYIIIISKAAIPLFIMLMFYYLVDVFCLYLERLASTTDTTLDDQLVPLLRKALKTFVVIVGIMFVLQNLNFNVTALLAGISIGGLAVALAAQDTLKNFFGSVMIFLDKPFQIGDWIVANDIDGDVEEVGFRSTRIRTFANSQVYVPNGKLADMTIDNMGRRGYRRYKTMLALTYDTPAHQVEAFVKGLEQIVVTHPSTRKDYYNIYFNTFNTFSLDVLFYIFFDVPTWGKELKARQEVNLAILELAKKLDVRFAIPTQRIHMEDLVDENSLTPQSYPTKEELEGRLNTDR